MRGFRLAACVTFLGCASFACADSLPRPSMVLPPDDAYEIVPYPPPAALSELVPGEPSGKNVVWVDGSWVFRGNYYVWQRGGWVENPDGASFAPWRVRYAADGRVEFATSSWRDPTGKRRRAPMLKSASSPPNEVTAEFQTGR